MKFQNYCIDLIVERDPTSSAHAAGGSPVSSSGTDNKIVKPNGLGNTSIVPAAPFPLDDQNKNIGLNRSDKYASIHSFSSPFISLDKKEENGSTLLSPASTSSVHDGSVPCTVLGQEKAQAPPTSSDLHVYHLKHDFNAANPAKDTVPNGSSGSDLLSVSPGASHHTDGSGFVLKTGGPVVLNVEGEEENTETGIHHENEFFDAFPPYGDVIGNRIDDTLLVLKSKVIDTQDAAFSTSVGTSDKAIFSSDLMEEQGDADVDVDGSDDDKFSTAAVTGGDVHSLPCKMGVRKSSSSTTVDSALNQINHIYAVLHEKQRAGKKVDSMYDEEQVAAAPDDEINNPLSNAKSSIVMIFLAISLLRKYLFNKGDDKRIFNRVSTRSWSFIRPRLVIRGMRTNPTMKSVLQVVILIMTCLPTAMSLAEFVCENDVEFRIPFKGESKSCQDIGRDDTVRRDLCNHEIVANNCPNICGLCCQDNATFSFPGELTGDPRTCTWITQNDKKTEVRRGSHCELIQSGFIVKDQCQLSCDFCFEPVETCFNDAEFLSKEFEGRERSCKNIRLNESRRNTLCQFDDVRMACPQSCGFCCIDTATYTFKSADKKRRTCGWISRRNAAARQNKYCNKFLNGATVRDKCPEACNFCFDPVIQSQSPSSTPNQSPTTKAPSAESPVVIDLAFAISGICKVTEELEVAMVTGIEESLACYAATAEIVRFEENCVAASDENSSSVSSLQSNYENRRLTGGTVAVEMKVVMWESFEQSVIVKLGEILAASVSAKCPPNENCDIDDFTGTQRNTKFPTPVPTKAPTHPAPSPLPLSSKPSVSSIPSAVPSADNNSIGDGGCVGFEACRFADNNTIGDEGCVGNRACYDADNNTIGNGGCDGYYACYDVDNITIGDGGCVGNKACYDANNSTIGDGGCVGEVACYFADNRGKKSYNSTIGDGGCVGNKACWSASNSIIGDGGCVGEEACYFASYPNSEKKSYNSTIGNGGCVGYQACSYADDSIIGDESCVGYGVCFSASNSIIGDESCVGLGACIISDHSIIGDESCVGLGACEYSDQSTIGDESCVGDQACYGAGGRIIGKNSCNCDGCCKRCGEDVPDGSCNTGNDNIVDGRCTYCRELN